MLRQRTAVKSTAQKPKHANKTKKVQKKQLKKSAVKITKRKQTNLLSPQPVILPDHIPYGGEEPTLMPELRNKHAKQIDALQETIQAKKYMQWLLDEEAKPAAQHASIDAIEKMRNAGLNENDALDLLRAGMMTFLTHVESRASSATNQGFYTIGPCGEELMGALALSLREHDGVALHYRHLATQILRQLRAGRSEEEILLDRARGHTVSILDPVTGGSHCAIGGGDYDFLVTSTLASQSTPAVGRAMGSGMVQWIKKSSAPEIPVMFPPDAVNVVSLGDGSINNGHFLSAINLAEYAKFRKFSCPVVFCVTDNDISISLRGFGYLNKQFLNKLQMPVYRADGTDALALYTASRDAIEDARKNQQPVFLYVNNITRRFGHSSADRQNAYQTAAEIDKRFNTNPLEGLSTLLHDAGVMGYAAQHKMFNELWTKTKRAFDCAVEEPKITSRQDMLERAAMPLAPVPNGTIMAGDVNNDTILNAKTNGKPDHTGVATTSQHSTESTDAPIIKQKHANNAFSQVVEDRSKFNVVQTRVHHRLHTPRSLADTTPELAQPPNGKDVMRKHMTRTFTELMTQYPQMVYIGEDVTHGGYYLVSDGLNKTFPGRVRDFTPDETPLLGAGMGFAQNGLIPIVEIPYIKYLDCAMDIFSEAAITSWLSNRKQPNGMIIRAQGVGRGIFGGNYHTTNLIYTLPGLDVLCWSNGADYARGMRYAALQAAHGRVIMSIDYTTLLNQRNVVDKDGDDSWRKPFTKSNELLDFEQVMVYGNNKQQHKDITGKQNTPKDKKVAIVTYGEGVPLALATRQNIVEQYGGETDIDIDVIDTPLLNRVPNGLKDVIGNYGNVVFADPCKDGMQPLANHSVLLQREQLLPQKWSSAGAQPTYNPLGNTVTFLSTDDIANEIFKLQPALKEGTKGMKF